MTQVLYVVLGVVAGICGGMFGIGGGAILIPACIYIWPYSTSGTGYDSGYFGSTNRLACSNALLSEREC